MRLTRLTDESDEYRDAREELRLSEVALAAQREQVASQRRSLPPGPTVSDYTFVEGPADLADDTPLRTPRLSELFGAPDRPADEPAERARGGHHAIPRPGRGRGAKDNCA